MSKYPNIAITALVGVLAGLAIYEMRLANNARAEVQRLQAQQAPLTTQIGNLRASLAGMTDQLAALLAENARLKTNSNQTELLKLRSEVTRLRPLQDDVATLQQMVTQSSAGPIEWKINELSDVGCASPVDALRTYIFSSRIDPAKLQNAIVGNDVDPASEDAMQDFIKNKKDPLNMMFGNMRMEGFRILSQGWLAPGKAQVELEAVAHGGIGVAQTFTLRKVNGEWKLVVFKVRDKQGNFSRLEFINADL